MKAFFLNIGENCLKVSSSSTFSIHSTKEHEGQTHRKSFHLSILPKAFRKYLSSQPHLKKVGGGREEGLGVDSGPYEKCFPKKLHLFQEFLTGVNVPSRVESFQNFFLEFIHHITRDYKIPSHKI